MDGMLRKLFLGFIRLHILHHAGEAPIYGSEIKAELERHGYRLSYGTLYPVLHSLERDGYLESQTKIKGGKQRRYYTLTSKGEKLLVEAKVKLRELTEEVLGEGL